MVFVTPALARQIEAVEAALVRDMARAKLEIVGGSAVYVTPESPLTHVVGIGMNGPVTAAELDEIEAFYSARGAPCSIELSPMADPSVPDLLARRAYGITEFANLLIRPLPTAQEIPAPCLQVIEAQPDEGEVWASVAARGFFERDQVSEEELEIGRVMFHAAPTRAFFATLDGQHAGVGALAVLAGIAVLYADSTLPCFRGRGAQLALVRARLAAAQTAGAELAIASTSPGSISQRNYQRCGFTPAYTKIAFQKS